MVEENKQPKKEIKLEDKKLEASKVPETASKETKTEIKTEVKKDPKPEVKKKEEAVAHAYDLHASKKHCMYICTFIKNKSIDQAISDLQDVTKLKRAIPFKGEIPHRKGKMMSGRYPVTVSQMFITILKGLKGNVAVNGLDLSKTRIYFAKADWAPRFPKRSGGRFKRAHVTLKAKEITK